MRALVTSAPRTMELREVDVAAEPGPGEVLLGIDAVGICGSDFGLYRGTHPYAQFPQVQGHEFCGTVRALGPDCEGTHAIGTRVAVEPLLPCGHCYPCSVGRSNCCMELRILGVHTPGALQEQLVVPERLLHDAGGMDAPSAAFAEPMSIALQGLVRAQVGEGDTVLVLGAEFADQARLDGGKFTDDRTSTPAQLFGLQHQLRDVDQICLLILWCRRGGMALQAAGSQQDLASVHFGPSCRRGGPSRRRQQRAERRAGR